jgi:hypothetical protein
LKEIREIAKGVIIPAKNKKNVEKLVKTPNNNFSKKLIF